MTKKKLFWICFFFGYPWGVHRFMTGKSIPITILYICTAGFFFVGFIIDLVSIYKGNYKDKQGNLIR